MFDRSIQKLTQKPLSFIAKFLLKFFHPNQISMLGFIFGILMSLSVFFQAYLIATILLFCNRLCDGLDGVMARQISPTLLGAYLDIIFDFVIYAAFIVAFSFHNDSNLIAGIFLLFGYICTGSTFLTQAIVQPQLDQSSFQQDNKDDEIPKSFIYASGLIEGTETIVFMVLCLLFPFAFPFLGILFALLCFLTAFARGFIFYQKYKIK